eukprot:8720758-Heterocapsa_arctica.AAC.1
MGRSAPDPNRACCGAATAGTAGQTRSSSTGRLGAAEVRPLRLCRHAVLDVLDLLVDAHRDFKDLVAKTFRVHTRRVVHLAILSVIIS